MRYKLLVLFLFAALVMVACGGSDTTSEPQAPSTETEQEEAAPEQEGYLTTHL